MKSDFYIMPHRDGYVVWRLGRKHPVSVMFDTESDARQWMQRLERIASLCRKH